MVRSANYIPNPELGEGGDPKMDKARFLPPETFWGEKKQPCLVTLLHTAGYGKC